MEEQRSSNLGPRGTKPPTSRRTKQEAADSKGHSVLTHDECLNLGLLHRAKILFSIVFFPQFIVFKRRLKIIWHGRQSHFKESPISLKNGRC